jgi:prolyl 4-hydroxylase
LQEAVLVYSNSRKYDMATSRLLLIFCVCLSFILSSSSSVEECDAESGVCQAIPKGANERGEPMQVKKGQCFDRHTVCKQYASGGECEKNPGWMIINCPVSCNACELLDPAVRCDRKRLNMSDTPIYAPGDISYMFKTLNDRFGDSYNITIHSQDPWVATIDNFVTDDEVDALIETVEGTWERSTDTGTANEFGEVGRVLSTGRTSSNAWCRDRCQTHPDVQFLMKRISEFTFIPPENSESFQILRYDVGQFYRAHHDYGGGPQGQLICGPRILTFFLYLSDVEEGGETAFPLLNIVVKPKKGTALLWPSVLDHDLLLHESRTLHEAKPVIRGRKYAANAWIHLYEYEKPNLWGEWCM